MFTKFDGKTLLKDHVPGGRYVPPGGDAIVNVKEKENKLVVTTAYDVTPILESCYEMKKNTKRSWSAGRKNVLGHHVGRIPEIVLDDWIKKGLVSLDHKGRMNKKDIHAMLNLHPEYKVTKKIL